MTTTEPGPRPVFHMAAAFGTQIPVFDDYDPGSGLLISDLGQAGRLASLLGSRKAALMRGHGGNGVLPQWFGPGEPVCGSEGSCPGRPEGDHEPQVITAVDRGSLGAAPAIRVFCQEAVTVRALPAGDGGSH